MTPPLVAIDKLQNDRFLTVKFIIVHETKHDSSDPKIPKTHYNK